MRCMICLPKELHEWPEKKHARTSKHSNPAAYPTSPDTHCGRMNHKTGKCPSSPKTCCYSCPLATAFCWQPSPCVGLARLPGAHHFPKPLALSFHRCYDAPVKMARRPVTAALTEWGGCLGRTTVPCQRLSVWNSSARWRFCLVRSSSAWSLPLGYRWKKRYFLVGGGTRCSLRSADLQPSRYLPLICNAALWAGQKQNSQPAPDTPVDQYCWGRHPDKNDIADLVSEYRC